MNIANTSPTLLYQPLYEQIKRMLTQSLIDGEWKAGEMIPSEVELAARFKVSQGTVRKALDELVSENILMRRQGKGTFVSFHDITHSMWNFSGFTDYARSKEEIPVSKVLCSEVIEADGQSYFKLVRARGMKSNLSVSWYTIDTSLTPLRIFPGIENMDFSQKKTVLFSPATSSFCQFRNFEERGRIFKELTVKILDK